MNEFLFFRIVDVQQIKADLTFETFIRHVSYISSYIRLRNVLYDLYFSFKYNLHLHLVVRGS